MMVYLACCATTVFNDQVRGVKLLVILTLLKQRSRITGSIATLDHPYYKYGHSQASSGAQGPQTFHLSGLTCPQELLATDTRS